MSSPKRSKKLPSRKQECISLNLKKINESQFESRELDLQDENPL